MKQLKSELWNNTDGNKDYVDYVLILVYSRYNQSWSLSDNEVFSDKDIEFPGIKSDLEKFILFLSLEV